ncbi:MAG: LEA type 2 family protein [Gemmatimonadales bacterium]|nr:LEA type 2 family protein [Gemmatimonadales bacterium]
MPHQLLFVWIPGVIVLLGGCTPLGLWMYEDPRIAVSRVSVARVRAGDSVRVALAVDNRNDYTVEATRVEVALRVDGMPIGSLAYDTLVPLPEEVVSLVAVPLRLGAASTDGRLRRIAPGTHQYQVEGRAEFRTPIGVRHVAFQEEGAMTFGLAARRE